MSNVIRIYADVLNKLFLAILPLNFISRGNLLYIILSRGQGPIAQNKKCKVELKNALKNYKMHTYYF
jgi:hypothetical protein